jgi:glucuronate isomerase
VATHPDRLLGAAPAVRDLARELYQAVAQAPILSPHGHVSARMLADDEPFADPAALLITPDHYVTRLLHSAGVPLEALGLVGAGQSPPPSGAAAPRAVWRTLAENWKLFAGTPVRYWLEDTLERVFGIDAEPGAAGAERLYDQLAELLGRPEFRPRALLERFGVELLATTDDPADSLQAHARLAAEGFGVRVIPTLRADAYMDPAQPGWAKRLDALAQASGMECGSYRGLLEALRARREHFRAHGATATDTGVQDAWATPLAQREAQAIHRRALAGESSSAEALAYRHNMLYQLGLMAAEDGLVMQLHAGVLRNHHRPTHERFGPDTGHDIPLASEFARPLRELLDAVGTSPRFQLVIFSTDEAAYGREIAPLAGFYPSVYVGAPWWFLDAPAAVRRWRAAVTETAGFYKTSGFVDDTRALCSIPSRHDMSRRLDARYLAELVADHQLSAGEAHALALALVDEIPRAAFRL